ncbi:MAG: DUF1800 domain-containing protein, partial [Verrucomicrobiota bacterium]
MLTPINAKKWDYEKAAHLLNRAGFGGSPEQIEALQKAGLDGAVNQMLAGESSSAPVDKPDWAQPHNVGEMKMELRNLPEEQRKEKFKAIGRMEQEHGMDLISWWLGRMSHGTDASLEKMTFFWHGHFATSIQKVKDPYLMWQQNETLRRNALGNFGTLVKAISRDPAMMVWLDTNQSLKQHPNENFARELMELFTLGIGNYTEEDIQQAARAFTGYRINLADQTFRFSDLLHDSDLKKFFGQTGSFNGEDIIDRILAKPACAKFIAKKIWRFFVYDEPEPALVEALGASFKAHNYEIKPLMNQIFRSAEFYSAQAVRSQIKSPVQWMVQTAKILDSDVPRGPVAVNALRQLGQVPFIPPNVKGWDGGKSWITTSTLLLRYNLANFEVGNGPFNIQRVGKLAGNKENAKPGFDVVNRSAPDLSKIAPEALRKDPKALVESLT